MWYLSGTDITIQIDYEKDGQSVVPETASFNLRSAGGVSLLAAPLLAETTTEFLAIPGIHNGLTLGSLFEHRFLQVDFVVDGATFTTMLSYQLAPFIPLTATPQQVRSLLGLDFSELGDSDIDLKAAYFQLAEENGVDFTAAFTLPGVRSLSANTAVALRAALNLATSLELRTGVSTRSEDHMFSRSTQLDFGSILMKLNQALAKALNVALGVVVTSSSGVQAFQLTLPTDVVTGA